jgi:hypothetical protein
MDTRSIERYIAVLGGVGILAAAVLAGGCTQIIGIEDLPPLPVDASPQNTPDASSRVPDASPQNIPDAAPVIIGPDAGLGYAVRGTSTGLLGPVALELRLGNETELLAVTTDGTFAFKAHLENGASYTVVLVDTNAPCTLRNQTGVIAGADTVIELKCTGPSLLNVVVSGVAPTITLVPGTTEYVVNLPLSQSSVTLAATVTTPGDTLTIASTSVANGAPSAPFTLNLGDNPVDIVVENHIGWQLTYRLTLRRATQLAQYAYGKASNTGAADHFGWNVALSGDTLVVGAPFEDSSATGVNGNQSDNATTDSGAVYVFRRTGTVWQQEAYLKASNTGADDEFGYSVAISGDTLAVGAHNEDSVATGINGNQSDNTATESGAVYVFRRNSTVWQQEAYLKASNTGAGDEFGISVTLSGDTLAVGALREDSAAIGVNGSQTDNTATDSGAVYVFRRTGTAWQQEAYLKASNTGASDIFGESMALSGDTLVVGAFREDSAATGVNGSQTDNTASDSGAAYVFRRTGTTWQQEAYLKASNTGAGDQFGNSVALSGDTIAVGAYAEASAATGVNGNQADNSIMYGGAAYVFRRTGTVWQQEAYIKASNTGAGDQFGYSVALSAESLLVAARYEASAATAINGNQADDSASLSGAAYVFRRTGTTWQQQAYLKASNTDASDNFGFSVAISGDTLVVAAQFERSTATGVNGNQADNSAGSCGAIYIFH